MNVVATSAVKGSQADRQGGKGFADAPLAIAKGKATALVNNSSIFMSRRSRGRGAFHTYAGWKEKWHLTGAANGATVGVWIIDNREPGRLLATDARCTPAVEYFKPTVCRRSDAPLDEQPRSRTPFKDTMQKQYARLIDEVTRALEEEILSGELRAGDHLTVLPLAQRFGMSQSTIREALLMLERRGLVKTIPRRGAYITRLAEDEAAELCRMRALIEGYAVTAGISNVDDSCIAELEGYIHEMALCQLPKNMPRLIQLDLAFHRRIAELANSDTLLEVWSSLSGRIGALMIRSLEANRLEIDDVIQFHTEVVDAMATRNPRAGCLAVSNHYLPHSPSRTLHMESIGQVVETLIKLEGRKQFNRTA